MKGWLYNWSGMIDMNEDLYEEAEQVGLSRFPGQSRTCYYTCRAARSRIIVIRSILEIHYITVLEDVMIKYRMITG